MNGPERVLDVYRLLAANPAEPEATAAQQEAYDRYLVSLAAARLMGPRSTGVHDASSR